MQILLQNDGIIVCQNRNVILFSSDLFFSNINYLENKSVHAFISLVVHNNKILLEALSIIANI